MAQEFQELIGMWQGWWKVFAFTVESLIVVRLMLLTVFFRSSGTVGFQSSKQKLLRLQGFCSSRCLSISISSSLISDHHDAVLRFNGAPTRGYQADVGQKTTIRLVNSQVSLHGMRCAKGATERSAY